MKPDNQEAADASVNSEPSFCQYCGKELPEGCSTEFQGESGCECFPADASGNSEPTPTCNNCGWYVVTGACCDRCGSHETR
jgi:hypothetical protein